MPAPVRVRVLVESNYLDTHMRALPLADRGDILEICGGWYADEMIAQGNVERLSDGVLGAEAPSTPPPPPAGEPTFTPTVPGPPAIEPTQTSRQARRTSLRRRGEE